MFNVGMTLISVCSLLLFLGLFTDGSIQFGSSLNWIGGLWTIVFLFGVLLLIISLPEQELK
jgi:hypothetical protein